MKRKKDPNTILGIRRCTQILMQLDSFQDNKHPCLQGEQILTTLVTINGSTIQITPTTNGATDLNNINIHFADGLHLYTGPNEY